jgi:hypothetical protein
LPRDDCDDATAAVANDCDHSDGGSSTPTSAATISLSVRRLAKFPER